MYKFRKSLNYEKIQKTISEKNIYIYVCVCTQYSDHRVFRYLENSNSVIMIRD